MQSKVLSWKNRGQWVWVWCLQSFRFECFQSLRPVRCAGWDGTFCRSFLGRLNEPVQGRALCCINPGGRGCYDNTLTCVHRVCKDLRLHPVWGEETPGGWCKVAAGTRERMLGFGNPRGPDSLHRGKGSSGVCSGHGGRQEGERRLCSSSPRLERPYQGTG